MKDSDHDFDEAPILNVMQVVALTVVASGTIFTAMKTTGYSWGLSLLCGWVGGSVATVVLLSGAYWLGTAASARKQGSMADSTALSQQKRGNKNALAALVPSNITDPMQVWETDRLLDLDHQLDTIGKKSDGSGHKGSSLADLVQAWRDDAAVEAEEARVTSQRRAPSDRRQASADRFWPERRVAQRRN